ncbi:MAG: calcium/sodium antiporter [Anaerolineales bacterium]
MTFVLFGLGFIFLFLGGELLVRGASRLATALGISPLVVGLTVVAFSTSAPELAVTVQSAFSGQADLAIGNIVGSNIANVLLILGLSAVSAPLVVQQQLIRVDVPIMIAASGLMALLAWDGLINSLDGALLFALLIAYTLLAIHLSRRESRAVKAEYAETYGRATAQSFRRWPINALLILVGVALLVIGAQWLVEGAVVIARWLGLSELIIGLTIIAVGTSLPELATSVIATLRGDRDLAVGNVVGSSIFNLFSVLGLTALIAPAGVPVLAAVFNFDLPVMIAVSIACLPVFFNGNRIARWEGAVFLGYYVAYTTYLVLNATQHATLPLFSGVMVWFVLPLTVITLAVVVVRTLRSRYVVRLHHRPDYERSDP